MEYRNYIGRDTQAIVSLVTDVFSKSENEKEGQLVGKLTKDLMNKTAEQDLLGFVAVDGQIIVGSIFFSRLRFKEAINAFILAPVAIHFEHQGRGIGQSLIKYGLEVLKQKQVELVTTYGDIAFYSKVGFHETKEAVVPAPLKLSQPEAWLGISLNSNEIEAIEGPSFCVEALNNPDYW